MYKHILMAYDGSIRSDKALNEATALAKSANSKLTLIYVVTPHHLLIGGGRDVPGLKRLEEQYEAEIDQEAKQMLDAARTRATAAGVAVDVLTEHGAAPHECILEAARRLKCDLIVMANQGRRGLEGIVVGSQTLKVLASSSIPVLVVR